MFKDVFEKINLPLTIYKTVYTVYFVFCIVNYKVWFNFIGVAFLAYIYLKMTNLFEPRDGNPLMTIALIRGVILLLKFCIFLDYQINYKAFFIAMAFEIFLCIIYIFDVDLYSEYLTEEELKDYLNK